MLDCLNALRIVGMDEDTKGLGNLETPSSTNLGQFQGLTEEAV